MAVKTPQLNLSSGLAIGYRSPLARTDQEIRLEPGTHFLIARNGRGKTTLLRTIARSLRHLAGDIEAQGQMQYLPEDLRFDAELPVHSLFRAMIPKARLQPALELAQRLELDLHKPYGKLSTGNRRKTGLIIAEFSLNPDEPNILLLDEPFSGLDARAREMFEDIWRASSDRILRLVSCHPDYDSMRMPSALLIHNETICHSREDGQTWSELKHQLN